jgi:hypothetical protein
VTDGPRLEKVEAMTYPVVHWEIGGRDAAALREFYHKAFGWDLTDAGPNYTLVAPADGGLGGGIMQLPEGTPPYETFYVQVDDLDAALAELQLLGGETLVPPTEIDTSASFALFTDPEGHPIGLLCRTGGEIGQ